MTTTKEGYLPYKGYKVYYKIVGTQKASKLPLLVLHGGPGSTHNYMLGLAALAKQDRQVIFYDQLGCGKSDSPDNDSLWEIPTFVKEVSVVRKQLGLDNIHLFGHSWGGMLAIEYLLTDPYGIHSVTLSSSMISMPLYQQEVELLKKDLPAKVYKTMVQHEAAGTTDSPEYLRAYQIYRDRHLFRGKEMPKELARPENSTGDAPYKKMWGASEAFANGTMKNWNRIDQLHKIKIPTLITSGQYDELTPHQAVITQAHIPKSELRIFTSGSHLSHVEHKVEYIKTLSRFLDSVEKNKK